MPAGAVAGAGIVSNIVGGIAGREAGRADAGEARNAMNIAFEELQRIGLPPDLTKKIIFEQFQQQGLLTPELEQEIQAGPSKVSEISEDPTLKNTQMEALKILTQRGKTGLNPEDRAALNKIRGDIATDTEAKRQQILQDFAARGQSGGGAELIAQLQASQAGSNQASQQGDELAAMASKNALEAITNAGTLGGQIRGQDFDVNREKAAAQDAIEQFNVQNRIGTQSRNVGAKNTAQASNLSEAQRLSDANKQQQNQELLRQNDAARQKWLDETQRQQILSGAQADRSQFLQGESARAAGQAAAPYEAIGAGLSAAGSFMNKPSTTTTKPKTTNKYDNMFQAYDGGEVPGYDEGGEVEHLSKLKEVFKTAFNEGSPAQNDDERRQEEYKRIREAQERDRNRKYNQGGIVNDFREGGKVPGVAIVSGDHPLNDIVPAMLSPEEIVVPRTIAKSKFGKKLLKLISDHHELKQEMTKNGRKD